MYHTPTTNHKYVDPQIDRLACSFVCGCNQLTPAREAELDQVFATMRKEEGYDEAIKTVQAEVQAEVMIDDAWMFATPTEDAFEFDDD